ncbi:MAG: lytic murein transglycosylase [Oceanococcaceae bacterium]
MTHLGLLSSLFSCRWRGGLGDACLPERHPAWHPERAWSLRHTRAGAAAAALSLALVTGMAAAQPAVVDEYTEPATFPACLAGLLDKAERSGVSADTRAGIIPELRWLPDVIAKDRRQPEFTLSFDRYFSRALNEQRVREGRRHYAEQRELLAELEQRFGVPGPYLVSFWGLETNYGSYLGTTPSLDALATLACDTRRSRYFESELLAALQVIDRHQLRPSDLRGSWAGALGQVQFMPSNYQRYGRDGDGDGRVDLFGSIPDALTSAAHFLNQLGWLPDQRWGREVRLPDGFDYALADGKTTRPLLRWRELGLRQANGGPLPVADFEAALHVPGGHRGAAFLTYQNFAVTKRWNNSNFYALAVGHLADRIAGAGPLVRMPTGEAPVLRIETVKAAQEQLNALGYTLGPADGIVGPGTRGAIRAFQSDRELIPDGHLDATLLDALGIMLPQ